MNLLSPAQARARLAEATGEPMSRANFNAKLIPLLAAAGDAKKVGREWVIDGGTFWMWEVYAATRQALIEAGMWPRSQPWSLEDMEAIAINDEYEDYSPGGGNHDAR